MYIYIYIYIYIYVCIYIYVYAYMKRYVLNTAGICIEHRWSSPVDPRPNPIHRLH